MSSPFFHMHAHSRYSALDGMASVQQMVDRAAHQDQPGLALTDHGLLSGSIELYKTCRKFNLVPFPGIEAYVVKNLDRASTRYHCCLLALNMDGYKALSRLSSMAFDFDHFFRKPRISWAELLKFGREHGKNVAITTGCYFGLVVQTLLTLGEDAAVRQVKMIGAAFQNTYVELQMHDTVQATGLTDREITSQLYKIAVQLSLPAVASQDSHYCDRADKIAHEMMKRLGYQSSDPSEVLFPGNSYHLASTGWMEKQYAGMMTEWQSCLVGCQDLLDHNKLKMPALDKYKFVVPDISHNATALLKFEAKNGLSLTGKEIFTSYEDRMKSELKTIQEMGFCNYFLLMQRVCKWMRRNRITFNARGSANGSLVCWVLGITDVDPLHWKISFDRFLHSSRQKPPDIDIDVDRDRRAEVLRYITDEMDLSVTPIGTFGTLADTNDRGSVFVKYLSYQRKLLGDKFANSPFASIDNLMDLDKIAPQDTPALRRLSEMRVYTGGGTHAAGYVLTDKGYPMFDYIPEMLIGGIKDGRFVTQMTQNSVEDAGFVKADFLGEAALTTVQKCLQMIREHPEEGLDWIPFDDKPTLKELSNGRTGTGVFQFQGYSTAQGAQRMKLKNMRDVILCLALTRPAAMGSGHTDEYLAYRNKQQTPRYLHSIFEKHTSDTFGVFILQDQVIDVLRAIGMSYEDLNDMLKAVKASNERIYEASKVFARLEPVFLKLCVTQGMSAQAARLAWSKVRDFSDYGFNKAHATAYGLLGYRMAYMKTHYPLHFMLSTLQTWAGTSSETGYQSEARRIGLNIYHADVNKSGLNWELVEVRKASYGLRKGLISVKGIGASVAAKILAARPEDYFESDEQVLKLCGKRAHDALFNAGALSSLIEEE